MLNFSTAIVVMRVQQKWRAKMRANKVRRKKQHRESRMGAVPITELWDQRAEMVARFRALRRAGLRKWTTNPDVRRMMMESEGTSIWKQGADTVKRLFAARA